MQGGGLDPRSTAVLFVECQNGLLGAETIMKTIAQAAQPIIPALGRLAVGAREAGAQVVHLTYAPVAGNRSSNRRPPLFARLLERQAAWGPGHPATQPIPQIGVGPDDLVLTRHTGLSPTYGTETFKLLRNIGIRTLVMAGISVNVALPVAATEAVDEDFDVIIPSDAVAGSPPEHVVSMLRHTLPFIATVAPVDDILAWWKAGSDATAKAGS
ncbi:cysteine hydrolase [Acidiferrimicrobium sp. IK]|uniref:cysteine hydrolase n=1 Tax=Acidiferrimicrobium sp. IK TaxID=2871700 RepID=UPI0021CB3131|nr:cysteine hydrolase [Acidiferrimicrobium sp. IK]MCU4184439.1 cysteine hydrolase [Acidiferrimicrobium sp. IK]